MFLFWFLENQRQLYAIEDCSVERAKLKVKHMYSLSELKRTFDFVTSRSHMGIPGVVRVRSASPGPILGITVCTHGNEPSGLAAIRYLLNDVDISTSLQCGTLFIVVNNIQAAERFFTAKNKEEERHARFIDINMNRLPKNMRRLANDRRYEIRRAQELCKVWQQFEVGLDIHSTTQRMKPMIVSRGREFYADLVRGFPIQVVLSNIDEVQIGSPAFGFFGKRGRKVPVFEIETGSHQSQQSFRCAVSCARTLLQNLGMLPGKRRAVSVKHKEYFIASSIVFPNETYELLRAGIRNFQFLHKGTPLATGIRNNRPLVMRAPFDCHVFFCSTTVKPSSIAEEVMFLSRPMRLRQ